MNLLAKDVLNGEVRRQLAEEEFAGWEAEAELDEGRKEVLERRAKREYLKRKEFFEGIMDPVFKKQREVKAAEAAIERNNANKKAPHDPAKPRHNSPAGGGSPAGAAAREGTGILAHKKVLFKGLEDLGELNGRNEREAAGKTGGRKGRSEEEQRENSSPKDKARKKQQSPPQQHYENDPHAPDLRLRDA